MNIAYWLDRTARRHPEGCAVALGEHPSLSFAQLARRSAGLASTLREKYELVPGDRLAVACSNHPSYLEILFGAWWAGLVPVPVNAKLHPSEMSWIVRNSGSRAAVATPDVHAHLSAEDLGDVVELLDVDSDAYQVSATAEPVAITARRPDDLAWLFYTSGTTGRPKGAMLTFRNLAAMSLNYLSQVDPTEAGDSLLHCAPMSHGSGMYVMATAARGGTNVIPESGGFDVEEVFSLLAAHRRASMFAAPTMVQRLTDHPGDVDGLNIRTIIWGGAPMQVDRIRLASDRFGPHLAQIYGQGESPMTIASLSAGTVADREDPRWLERLASAGLPSPVLDVQLRDGDGNDLPVGEVGEIVVRGDTVMTGYWNDPAGTSRALRDGWVHTGDIGFMNDEGFLTLCGRSKDVIISGGSNIYPREVEDTLSQHAGVDEVSVIGRPDKDWGEVVVAYVVGRARADELDSLCLRHLGRFKRPKDYVFVQELPRGANGKVLKTRVREIDHG